MSVLNIFVDVLQRSLAWSGVMSSADVET